MVPSRITETIWYRQMEGPRVDRSVKKEVFKFHDGGIFIGKESPIRKFRNILG
jgi:hypothetical protein